MSEPNQLASTGAEEPDLVGQVLSSKFKIERLLGAGGMGAVYVAEHVFTRRKGALKLLHKSFAQLPEVVERFIREASAAGLIRNPHIVETYDAGLLESGEPYMFMELLEGESVESLLAHRRRLELTEAAEIAAQAARGLAAAHETGIVHRDIKPGNLFLVSGAEPFIKLLDFGISKFAPVYDDDPKLTVEGNMLGTPLYMPPEQVAGKVDLDHRADIYSLGVVLYEMLAGVPPFQASSLMELSVRIHEGVYTPPSQLRPDLPPGFDALLQRAVCVDRDARFASVLEFRDALIELFRLTPHEFSLRPSRNASGAPRRSEQVVVGSAPPNSAFTSEPTRPGHGPAPTPSAPRPQSFSPPGNTVVASSTTGAVASAERGTTPSSGSSSKLWWVLGACVLVALAVVGVLSVTGNPTDPTAETPQAETNPDPATTAPADIKSAAGSEPGANSNPETRRPGPGTTAEPGTAEPGTAVQSPEQGEPASPKPPKKSAGKQPGTTIPKPATSASTPKHTPSPPDNGAPAPSSSPTPSPTSRAKQDGLADNPFAE